MSTSAADSTAAFFAKKKKKKSYKGFNANKIDVASITPTVHVDAPAISEESTTLSTDKESQWDEQEASSVAPRVVVNTNEILDVKTLSQNTLRESDSIQERLKLEETKAALQAARDGMEREAARLVKEEQAKEHCTGGRFGAASQNVTTATTSSTSSTVSGGKWVPPHMRSGGGGGGASLSSTRRSTSSSFQKLNTKDETLFPDLLTADKILEQEKRQEAALYKPPKKTPVGGTWGMKAAASTSRNSTSAVQKQTLGPKEEAAATTTVEPVNVAVAAREPDSKPAPVASSEPAPVASSEPASVASSEPVAPVTVEQPAPIVDAPVTAATDVHKTMPVKKKKKKKDLSTFKPASS